jgi:two-component system, OmpR family, sensor histidine kinase QseC
LKTRSIRSVLLAGTVALLVAVLGAAAWLGFEAGHDEAEELFDARLATSARVLALLMSELTALPTQSPVVVSIPAVLETAVHDAATPLGHHYETKIAFQVRDAGGKLLMRSSLAPEAPYAPLEGGFSNQRFDERGWRVFTLRSGALWIHAADRDVVRNELSAKIARATVAPLIVGIPLLLLLLGLLTRYGLAPLAELARRLAGRKAGSIAPIELSRSTTEIAPVLEALNGLLERERRFTADAAHELRTPIAAIKIHAQNAARAAGDEERNASLGRMLTAVDRSARLADQMLAYRRATVTHAPLPAQRISMRQVLEDALEEATPVLKERSQKLSVRTDPPMEDIALRGDHEKLVSLVRNLLENAMRYAPQGSGIEVEVRAQPDAVAVSVTDEGPGIPPELRSRVFEGYYRIPGTPGEGSGLGLAIVREIAAQHGARIDIGEGRQGRGTRIAVSFPA